MNSLIKLGLLSGLVFGSIVSHAHEGHQHGPSTVEAPQGGAMRSLETMHLELLTEGDFIRVYLYGKDLKPKPVKDVPVKASVSLPRKKAESITLADKGNHWEAEYKAPPVHRYTLTLIVKQAGHDDKIEYTIEKK